MAKVFQRVWRVGPRKVKRAASGYTVQIDGKQEPRFSVERTKEDAEKELAARVLNVEQPDQRKAAPGGLTLAQAAERYLAAKARKRSLFRDRAFLEHFKAEFGVNTPLSEITASRISEYRDRRLGATTTRYKDAEGQPRALSAATINRPLQVLRSLLRLARDEWEALPKVPRIRFEKEPQGRIRWLEPDEEHRLLAACETSTRPDLHKIATVALETGLRKGEVMGLTWERVDFSRGVIRLEHTKSGRRREVPMRQAVYDTLAPLRALAAEVLPTEEEADRRTGPRGRVWPHRFPRRAWGQALERAGLEDFHFHDCRHHFASWFVMRRGSLQALKEILGHATLAMTMRYAHLAPEHLRAEVAKTERPAQTAAVLAQASTQEPADLVGVSQKSLK
jgi:integrase